MKYRKKPVVIEAFQLFIDDFSSEVQRQYPTWFELKQHAGDISLDHDFRGGEEVKTASIQTLEGIMTANEGDYIIKGIKGEIYPCREDIFLATYEKVKE